MGREGCQATGVSARSRRHPSLATGRRHHARRTGPRSFTDPLSTFDMKKMFVGNLPPHASDESVRALFSEFGTVRSIEVIRDLFTRKCKGFGFVEMEGHEARAAISALDGKSYDGNVLRVRYGEERPRGRGKKRR